MKRFLLDKRTRNKCHIFAMLAKNARKKHLSFHTPGHKIGKWDLTELSFSDNLVSPSGCIARAEEDVAKILDATASFLLTDGSTSGVFSMLHAVKSLGVTTVVLPAFSHTSAFHACETLGLKTIVVGQATGAFLQPSAEKLIENASDAGAIFVTSPTYYGDFPDLTTLRAYADETGKYLLVDGAHGGHLHFDKPHYAGTYAHFWVDGVHKSLPALTQGAVVSANGEQESSALYNSVRIFRTTSPSYPILASVEYAVKYPRNLALETEVLDFIEDNDAFIRFGGDWTKLCVAFDNPKDVASLLEERGVYPEFYDDEYVVFYLSPATSLGAFKRLRRELLRLKGRFLQTQNTDEKTVKSLPAPSKTRKINKKTVFIPLAVSVGRRVATDVGLFPPCTPILQKGERITEDAVRLLSLAQGTFGLQNGKIPVYEDTKTRSTL